MQLHEKTTCSLFSKRVTTKAILSTQLKVHMSQFSDSEQCFHNWYFNNFIKEAYTTTLLQRIISNLLLQRINITMTCAPFLVERTASLVIPPCETDNKWFKISVTVTFRLEQCLGQQIDVFCNSISIPRDKISCNLVTFKWNK